MESLRKVLRKSRQSSNHEKMKDKVGEEQESVRLGVRFYLDYIGSTLVEELDEGLSYGNKICAKAVNIIMNMAKSMKKQDKVELDISSKGIIVTNLECKEVFTSLSIYRIHFCTADKTHDKVFAYIARNTENENMECHAFVCPKRKMAEAVTLTVAQAFQIAKEDFEEQEEEMQRQKHQNAFGERNLASSSNSTASSQHKSQGFEDSFTDSAEFPSFRSKSVAKPFTKATFNTDLSAEQVEHALQSWLGNSQMEAPNQLSRADNLITL